MTTRIQGSATWDEDATEDLGQLVRSSRTPVDLDDIQDGRCKASSWRDRGVTRQRPTYENHFGPGGYNRCIGTEGHTNSRHKDEWGHVFEVDEDGTNFRVIRMEPANA